MINIKDLDCEKFLETNSPDAIVLALLCDFKGINPTIIVEQILLKLRSLLNGQEFKRYYMMLEELSSLKDLQKTIEEVDMRLSDITFKDYPSYNIGMKKGIEQGIQQATQEKLKERKRLIKTMLEFGISLETIAQKLELDVNELLKEINES